MISIFKEHKSRFLESLYICFDILCTLSQSEMYSLMALIKQVTWLSVPSVNPCNGYTLCCHLPTCSWVCSVSECPATWGSLLSTQPQGLSRTHLIFTLKYRATSAYIGSYRKCLSAVKILTVGDNKASIRGPQMYGFISFAVQKLLGKDNWVRSTLPSRRK